jgi:hypothetical protein
VVDVETEESRRELARRVNGGVEVALYWRPEDGSTTVELTELAFGVTFSFEVPRDRALDAFHHPFAHLQLAHVELAA